MNEYEEEAWAELEAKQTRKSMDNIDRLLNKLAISFLTHQEVDELAHEVRALRKNADRYKWLNKYTCQLFMVTEQQMDDQIDAAMTGVRK
jgi:hypothetical protein